MKKIPIISNEVWLIEDKRPGTFSQVLALAKEICDQTGFIQKKIKVDYNFLAKLPNFLIKNSLIHVSSKTKLFLNNIQSLPKLIIGAGRRSATISLWLKNKFGEEVKNLQIMNPNLNFNKFDFVILPEHDKFSQKNSANILTTIGALNSINCNFSKQEEKKFFDCFLSKKKVTIALLIGGSGKNTNFNEESMLNLCLQINKITKEMDAQLLILNSRRTSENLNQIIKKSFDCVFNFFDWKIVKENNPYPFILKMADFFVITGDSVSMISECCSTGKSVYIFDEKKISSSKHKVFHQNLFDKNYARKLDKSMIKLEIFSPEILFESRRIAKVILEKLSKNNFDY
jgi:hypothetical protein